MRNDDGKVREDQKSIKNKGKYVFFSAVCEVGKLHFWLVKFSEENE